MSLAVGTALLRVLGDTKQAVNEFSKLSRAQQKVADGTARMSVGMSSSMGGILQGARAANVALLGVTGALIAMKKALDFAPQTESVKRANETLAHLGSSIKDFLGMIGEGLAFLVNKLADLGILDTPGSRAYTWTKEQEKSRAALEGKGYTLHSTNRDVVKGTIKSFAMVAPSDFFGLDDLAGMSDDDVLALYDQSLRSGIPLPKQVVKRAVELAYKRNPNLRKASASFQADLALLTRLTGGGPKRLPIASGEDPEEDLKKALARYEVAHPTQDIAGVVGRRSPEERLSEMRQQRELADFQQSLTEQTSLVGASFQTMSSGIMAGVDAAITGSDAIGKAALKATAATLKSISLQCTAESVKHAAYALGALAFSRPDAAGKHALTAAKFAAGALLAGSLASGIGGSVGAFGGGGVASAGAGGGFASNAGSRPQEGQTIIIQVGDGFIGKPKEFAEEIDNKLRAGKRAGRIRDGGDVVTFS